MIKPMLGLIACICLTCTTAPARSQDDAIAITTHILENHLTDEISRKWYGGETICLFGPYRDNRTGVQIGLFLEAVNRAYGSDFKLTKAPWHDSCPDFTTIYTMVSEPVGTETLADILESLGGIRPPIAYMKRISGTHGFTVRIPGNRRREFVYVDCAVPSVSSNPDPVRSILIEQMTYALTTLSDFETDSIVSVFGKMLDVAYYDDWFDSNPRGLCLADLILLEMQIGRNVGQFSRRGASLDWLKDHTQALRDLVPVLQDQLADFTDHRCQG